MSHKLNPEWWEDDYEDPIKVSYEGPKFGGVLVWHPEKAPNTTPESIILSASDCPHVPAVIDLLNRMTERINAVERFVNQHPNTLSTGAINMILAGHRLSLELDGKTFIFNEQS